VVIDPDPLGTSRSSSSSSPLEVTVRKNGSSPGSVSTTSFCLPHDQAQMMCVVWTGIEGSDPFHPRVEHPLGRKFDLGAVEYGLLSHLTR
jgi:hypothetical protein